MMEAISTVVALAFVLGLAYAAIWVMKGMQASAHSRGDARVLSTVPIGPRERLVVVEWRAETLLLGVGGGAISVLDRRPAGQPGAAPSTDLKLYEGGRKKDGESRP